MRGPKCNKEMKNIKSFAPNKSYQMNICKCGKQTKQKRIHYDKNGMILEN